MKIYLNGPGIQYSGFVVWNAGETQVIASYIFGVLTQEAILDASSQVDTMDTIREDLLKIAPTTEMFAFSFTFLFYEQYVVIIDELFQVLFVCFFVLFLDLCVCVCHKKTRNNKKKNSAIFLLSFEDIFYVI